MNEKTDDQVKILSEMRDLQRESLALSREQFAMAKKQFERAEALHTRAEKIQERSESMLSGARKAMVVIVPIIVVSLLYLTWLIFR